MLPDRLRALIQLLSRLPGVGEKTAQRYALFLASEGSGVARDLGGELASLVDSVRPCDRCRNLAEVDQTGAALCAVCRDTRRDPSLLCVVAPRLRRDW